MSAPGSIDRDFGRYRETRDPAVLAQVFDGAAPELLRVAVHLVGRAGEAEDLVQATFVAAIEQAESYDPRREALPWLLGILANKARMAKRSAARELDPARLEARAEAGPLDEALGAELSGELAKAIDRLEEPYRRVLVLRLRHGLAPADIAHALGESPGAVRVRIHRGLEELRRCLPAGLGAALIALVEPARGLVAVREAVLAHAHTASAVVGVGTSVAIGGTLLSKKTFVLAAVALAALSIPLWNHFAARSEDVTGPAAPELASALLAGAEPQSTEEPADTAEEPAAMSAERADVGVAPLASGEPLRGLVIDGADDSPLAGVLVEVHAPARVTLRAARERGYDLLAQHGNNTVVGCGRGGKNAQSFWDMTGVLEDDELTVQGEVEFDAKPVASTRTNTDGRFEVPGPVANTTLAFASESHGQCTLAVVAEANDLVITLLRPRRLAGRVVDQDGRPVEREVSLVAYAKVAERAGTGGRGAMGYIVFAEGWPFRTDGHGAFVVDLPVKSVDLRVVTPGLIESPAFQVFDTGAGAPALVKTIVTPFLHIRDARTGAPIEHFSIVSRDQNGLVRSSGDQFARGGAFALVQRESSLRYASGAHDITVWADGYAPSTQHVPDLSAAGEILFELVPGVLPVLSGCLSLGGEPVGGARMWLKAYRASGWRAIDHVRGDGCRTDADGRFRLSMAPGRYVLAIDSELGIFSETLELEKDLERAIDLANGGRVVVEIRDGQGTLRPAHTIALSGDDGRHSTLETDASGRAEFLWLPDGRYQLHAPLVPTKGSFSGGVLGSAEVSGSSTEFVTMTLPAPSGPIRVRIVAEGVSDYTGWLAVHTQRPGTAVEPDGTIPIDLAASNYRFFRIISPDQRHWEVDVPREARDGHEIRLAVEGPSYEGIVLDRESGAPIAHLRVTAAPKEGEGDGGVSPGDWTDERGRFRIVCGEVARHSLGFEGGKTTAVGGMNRGDMYEGVRFELANLPSDSPEPIEIRIPRFDKDRFVGMRSKQLRGHVRSVRNGESVAGVQVSITAAESMEQGTLTLWSWVWSDVDGRYEIVVPDAPSYRAYVFDSQLDRRVEATWDGVAGRDETRDFELP